VLLTGSICLFDTVLRATSNYFPIMDVESQKCTAVKVPRQCPLIRLAEMKMKLWLSEAGSLMRSGLLAASSRNFG
jgi:hypothetical protein